MILWLVVILSSVTLVCVVLKVNKAYTHKPLQRIQHDVEQYDSWAILLTDSESLLRESFAEIGETGFFMDKRAVPYAEKLLDESELEISSSYNMGVVLNVSKKSKKHRWLKQNSWRYGFIPQGEQGNFRYVGVFPAEQMYYSGLTLDEMQELQASLNAQD